MATPRTVSISVEWQNGKIYNYPSGYIIKKNIENGRLSVYNAEKRCITKNLKSWAKAKALLPDFK